MAAAEPVGFESEVWPILRAHCLACHGDIQHYSSLRLDTPEGIRRGGDLGEVLVPGKPDESSLYTRTDLPPDDLDFMPVEGDPLSEAQRAVLRRWIFEGADFGDWKSSSPLRPGVDRSSSHVNGNI